MPHPRKLLALGATLFALLAPAVAPAQLITIKTLPLAQGDQFGFLPSANEAMGGVSKIGRASCRERV